MTLLYYLILALSITFLAAWRKELFLYIIAIITLIVFSVPVSEESLDMAIPLWLMAIYMVFKSFTYYFQRR